LFLLAYKVQVFKPYENGNNSGKYRLAVVDPDQALKYPANFVCILPKSLHEKNKSPSNFERKFGERNIEFAIELLKDAINLEKDTRTNAELQKRLNILEMERKL
jgi:hypothetical protein